MEPQTEAAAAPSGTAIQYVLFNERGLRAGWRLLIFGGILYTINSLFALAARTAQKYAGSGASPSAGVPRFDLPYFFPLALAIGDLAVFLVVLLISWLMSRIERREVGVYGLPLRKPALSNFFIGYVFWGFLPLSLLLLVMRGLHVFYFGGFSLSGIHILYWGLLWGVGFLMVGLAEEYLFRGYALYTLADGIGYWPAAIIVAVWFAYVHMGNGGESLIGICGVFMYALFAASTLRYTGNLWLAVGAHAGWDWGQTFFYGVSDSGLQAPGHLLAPSVRGREWLSGGSVGPEGSVLTLVLLAMMTAAVVLTYRARATSPEKKRQAG